MATLDDVRASVLEHGTIDWVGLWVFPLTIREDLGVNEEESRKLTIQLARGLLEDGLFEVGDIDWEKKRFVSWRLDPEEAITRIDEEWTQLGKEPGLSEIAWFAITEKGKTVAQSESSAS